MLREGSENLFFLANTRYQLCVKTRRLLSDGWRQLYQQVISKMY